MANRRKRITIDLGIVTLLLVILKLTGNIHWSWIWVLSPIWIPTLLFIFIMFFFLIMPVVVATISLLIESLRKK